MRHVVVHERFVNLLGLRKLVQFPQQVALLEPGVEHQVALLIPLHQVLDQPVGLGKIGVLAAALRLQRRLVERIGRVGVVGKFVGELCEQLLGLHGLVLLLVVLGFDKVGIHRGVRPREIRAQFLQQLQRIRLAPEGKARLALQQRPRAFHLALQRRRHAFQFRRQRVHQLERLLRLARLE